MPLIFNDDDAIQAAIDNLQFNIPLLVVPQPVPWQARIEQPRGQEEFQRQLYDLPEFPPDGSLC
jgi:hypothetical protein